MMITLPCFVYTKVDKIFWTIKSRWFMLINCPSFQCRSSIQLNEPLNAKRQWIGSIMLISCCPVFSTISLTLVTVWQLFATCHFFIRHKTTLPLGCLSEIWNFVSKWQSRCALLFIFTHPQEYWWYYFLRVPSFPLGDLPSSNY